MKNFFAKLKTSVRKLLYDTQSIYDFYIGYQYYIVIIIKEKDQVIFNRLISKLLCMPINIYWYRNEIEMMEAIEYQSLGETNFIIIG